MTSQILTSILLLLLFSCKNIGFNTGKGELNIENNYLNINNFESYISKKNDEIRELEKIDNLNDKDRIELKKINDELSKLGTTVKQLESDTLSSVKNNKGEKIKKLTPKKSRVIKSTQKRIDQNLKILQDKYQTLKAESSYKSSIPFVPVLEGDFFRTPYNLSSDSIVVSFSNQDKLLESIIEEHLNNNNNSLALNLFQKLRKLYPSEGRYHNNAGILLSRLGEKNKSIHAFRAAVKNKPKNTFYLYNLGVAYLKSGFKGRAKNAFNRSRRLGNKAACEQYRELTAKVKHHLRSVCCDGTISFSTGQGTCSHHKGVCKVEKISYKDYNIDCI